MRPTRRFILLLVATLVLKGLWVPPAVAMDHEPLAAHVHATSMEGHECHEEAPPAPQAEKGAQCQLQCEAALSPCLLVEPVVFRDIGRPALRTVYRTLDLGVAPRPDRPPPNA